MIKWLAWSLLIPCCLKAHQPSYELFVDPYASPFMGSELALTLHKSLEVREDGLFDQNIPPKKTFWAGFGRWAELVFLWNPLNAFTDVVQHEVFGHGYRIRTLRDGQVKGYSFGWPHPYGKGGGATSWNVGADLKIGQLQAVNLAGLEAENILARNLKLKWLTQGYIEPRAASLYNRAQLSPLSYAIATSTDLLENLEDYDLFDGNDVIAYLATLDLLYPQLDPLRVDKLRKKLLYSLIDPTLYYSLVAELYYIFTGKNFPMFMVRIGDLKWLPNISVQLAPYGLEYYVENYFVYKEKPLYTYLKAGYHGDLEYFGLGMHYDEMISHDNMSYGVRFDSWYQPNFLVSWTMQELIDGMRPLDTYGPSLEKKWGASLSIVSRWRIRDTLNFFYSDLGYKTKGYLPGFSLSASPTIRVGFSAAF